MISHAEVLPCDADTHEGPAATPLNPGLGLYLLLRSRFAEDYEFRNRSGRNICDEQKFERAERALAEIRERLMVAGAEEQFQAS
jgi:hypothetical protein